MKKHKQYKAMDLEMINDRPHLHQDAELEKPIQSNENHKMIQHSIFQSLNKNQNNSPAIAQTPQLQENSDQGNKFKHATAGGPLKLNFTKSNFHTMRDNGGAGTSMNTDHGTIFPQSISKKRGQSIENSRNFNIRDTSLGRATQLSQLHQTVDNSFALDHKRQSQFQSNKSYMPLNYRLRPLNDIDNSFENVQNLVMEAIEELRIDLSKRPIEREDVYKIVQLIGVQISQFQTIEALFFSRQSTQDSAMFRMDYLVQWLCRNLPCLRPVRQNLNRTALNQGSSNDIEDNQFVVGNTSRKNFQSVLKANLSKQYQTSKYNPYESMSTMNYNNRTIYADTSFKVHVKDTVKILDKLPKLKQNVMFKMQQWQSERESAAAREGVVGSLKAREGIKLYYKKKEEEEEALLRKFIENEPNACHASNLYRLLTKRWTEEPNAFKICSKITPKKEKRIKEILLEDRYNS